MKRLSLVLILGICGWTAPSIEAQVKRRPASPGVTTQSATTEDGRKVILRSNKTWEYETASAAGITPKAILALEAGLVYKSGDVKPVARTKFYLLDASLATIFQAAGLQAENIYGDAGKPERDYAMTFGFATKYPSADKYSAFYPKAVEALNPHTVQTATTDFTGKLKFSPVPKGTYYLVGQAETPRSFVMWNLRVDLVDGENSVTLDQNNAVE